MLVRELKNSDEKLLNAYFNSLSLDTLGRFGPHAFDNDTITQICNGSYKNCIAYICLDDGIIVGYAIVKRGYVEYDMPRLSNYAIRMDIENDYTLAPSIADRYQSKGYGGTLYQFIEENLLASGARKIILWGGVQHTNQRAIGFYRKHWFKTLGEFEHNGLNLDMVKDLSGKL